MSNRKREKQLRKAPTDRVEILPLSALVPYDKNPRVHSQEQVDKLAASLTRHGQSQLILVDENNEIIAGHGRYLAAKQLGWKEVRVCVASGWSEAEKKEYRIKDNQLALDSAWDSVLLQGEITELGMSIDDLAGIGFNLETLKELQLKLPGMESEDDGIDRGRLLSLVNVTNPEPKTVVERGDHWMLSNKHHLLCVNVIDGWPKWSPFLIEGSLFCPYPGVFVPFSDRVKDHTLVMVQPDPYIAAHILDRYVEANGKKAIAKISDEL